MGNRIQNGETIGVVTMILKKRFSRIIAFILSCALVGLCIFQCVFIINVNMDEVEKRSERDDVIESYGYTHDMNYLFDQLWALSNIYLRNADAKNQYTCSKEYEKAIKKTLTDLGLMDKSGNPVINNPRNLEYMASCGDNVLTNITGSPEKLKTAYSIEYINGREESYTVGLNCNHNTDIYWYTTNYGLTYYVLGGSLPKRAVALYDFDTTGLDSYTDYNGAQIFYKTDGTMPVPDIGRFSNEEIVYANREAFEQFEHERDTEYILPDETYDYRDYDEEKNYTYVNDMSEVTDTGVFMVYDENSRECVKINKNKFEKYNKSNSDISIYIKPSDELIAEYEQYRSHRDEVEQDSVHKMIPFAVIGIAGVIIALLLLFCCGYSTEKKGFVLSMPDHIFAELPVVLIAASVLAAASMVDSGVNELRGAFDDYYTSYDMGGIIAGSAFTAIYAIILGCLITLVNRIKCRSLFKTSLTGRILAFVWKYVKKFCSYLKRDYEKRSFRHIEKNALRKDIFMRRFIIRTAIAVGAEFINCILFIPTELWESFVFITLILLAAYVFFSIRDHIEIAGISKQIAEMNGGDYSPRTVPEKSPAYGTVNNLNNISAGIRSAVDQQVKSERMKIELVTNVSHDLKTPLTSIISYIDLLSAEEMSPAARDYVTIISQKSDRLKSMVSDLFDLAKATSHTDVNNEQIDAVILTNQVLGDMSDKISQSGIEIRTDIKAQSAPIMAEGKKLYRVLQNLIDNSLKYSMSGTRIYITLENDDTYTQISVKNISAEEMDFTPEEIMERFTRGDRSRTTEGNGLGLSIAKSFTEACGGKFEIVLDGDMFTAVVKLPLIK